MKLPTSKMVGDYACPCGNRKLQAQALASFSVSNGEVKEVSGLDGLCMADAEISCKACGRAGRGIMFDRTPMDLDAVFDRIAMYVNYAKRKERIAAGLLYALGLDLEQPEKGRYTLTVLPESKDDNNVQDDVGPPDQRLGSK